MSNYYPILVCFGTRPEWLKIKPLLHLLERNCYKLLFTGQHLDLIKDIHIDYKIDIEYLDNRLDSIILNCLKQFPDGDFRYVLVQGDTASAFGCALAAFNRGIKILYLESGLRSYDLQNPYPEEGYRQMISRISNINLAPTQISAKNLISEKIQGEIHVVGNTVLDNLIKYEDVSYGNTILVTMHRRENHSRLDEWFKEINSLAISYPNLQFLLPIHPNPNVLKHINLLSHVCILEPMTHEQIINILKNCKLVITDSGGLQEEGSFFNKKVIVCRKITERPEGIKSGHLYICDDPKKLHYLFEHLEKNYLISEPCPYGDGRSSEKIKQILDEGF